MKRATQCGKFNRASPPVISHYRIKMLKCNLSKTTCFNTCHMVTRWGTGNVQTFLQESESIAAKQNPILDTDILFKQYFSLYFVLKMFQYFNPKSNLANILVKFYGWKINIRLKTFGWIFLKSAIAGSLHSARELLRVITTSHSEGRRQDALICLCSSEDTSQKNVPGDGGVSTVHGWYHMSVSQITEVSI